MNQILRGKKSFDIILLILFFDYLIIKSNQNEITISYFIQIFGLDWIGFQYKNQNFIQSNEKNQLLFVYIFSWFIILLLWFTLDLLVYNFVTVVYIVSQYE